MTTAGPDGPVGFWGIDMGTAIGVPFVAAEPRTTAAVFGQHWPDALAPHEERITIPIEFGYKNTSRGIVALVFRCRTEGGCEQLSDESTAVEWLTPDEVADRMAEVYAVRVADALLDGPTQVRTHDGRAFAQRAEHITRKG